MINQIQLNDDNIGFVQQYDFSTANKSYEDRVKAITTIASICWDNPKAIGNEKLFDALGDENKGIPSSSYAFIPILLTEKQVMDISEQYGNIYGDTFVNKYGEWVKDETYFLSNLRALISDLGYEKSKEFYNTSDKEIALIKKAYKVFKVNIDMATSKQFIRHQLHLQELSRRYVPESKKPFMFYESEDMKELEFKREDFKIMDLSEIYQQQVKYYQQAIEQGVKPESARRLIPQSAYTQIWSGFLPSILDNYLTLRTKKKTQLEHRLLAEGMQTLLDKEYK